MTREKDRLPCEIEMVIQQLGDERTDYAEPKIEISIDAEEAGRLVGEAGRIAAVMVGIVLAGLAISFDKKT